VLVRDTTAGRDVIDGGWVFMPRSSFALLISRDGVLLSRLRADTSVALRPSLYDGGTVPVSGHDPMAF